jgi:hypothetical protein
MFQVPLLCLAVLFSGGIKMSDWPELEEAFRKKQEEAKQREIAENQKRVKEADIYEFELQRRNNILKRIEEIFRQWDGTIQKYLSQLAEATWKKDEWKTRFEYPSDPRLTVNPLNRGYDLNSNEFDNYASRAIISWSAGWYVRNERNFGEDVSEDGAGYKVEIRLENFIPVKIIITGKIKLEIKPTEGELKKALVTMYEEGAGDYKVFLH